MPITHVIAHHLQHDADHPTKLSLRQDELTVGEQQDALLNKLKSSFLARLSRKHGSFSSEGESASLLAQELEGFLEGNRSFTQLTMTVMEQFKDGLNESPIELDAHFLFFIEQSGDEHHLFHLFVVNQSESLAINDNLEVAPCFFIDTGPSLFGIKVDLAEWKVRKNYVPLSLIPPRGNLLFAEIFEKTIGFSDGIDKEEDTLAFLEGIESYAQQLPDEKVNDYRAQVVDYCTEREGRDEPVNISGLSKSLDDIDAAMFVREVTGRNPQRDEDVMIDRRSLRRYVKFSGREKDLAISFSSYQLNNRINYDADNDTLSIKGIPKALRNQLLGHIKTK